MKFVSCVRAAALAAAVVSFAAPATGQVANVNQLSKAQSDEVYCVHDELEKDRAVMLAVAEALLNDEVTQVAEAVIQKAGETCKTRYKWDEAKYTLAGGIGLTGATMEYLVEELLAEGLNQDHIDAIDRVLGKLSRDDLELFLDPDMLEDEEFVSSLNLLLADEKFPTDDDYNLEAAHLIMMMFVIRTSAITEWIDTYIDKKN